MNPSGAVCMLGVTNEGTYHVRGTLETIENGMVVLSLFYWHMRKVGLSHSMPIIGLSRIVPKKLI